MTDAVFVMFIIFLRRQGVVLYKKQIINFGSGLEWWQWTIRTQDLGFIS